MAKNYVNSCRKKVIQDVLYFRQDFPKKHKVIITKKSFINVKQQLSHERILDEFSEIGSETWYFSDKA